MRKKPAKPATAESGPIARTIAEIATGLRCPKCGRSTAFSGHECKAR
jgi:hypothetical protein